MPNKYHEALNVAMHAIKHYEIPAYQKSDGATSEPVAYRCECIDKLAELQNALQKIAQLKQSLKELDLEESK